LLGGLSTSPAQVRGGFQEELKKRLEFVRFHEYRKIETIFFSISPLPAIVPRK